MNEKMKTAFMIMLIILIVGLNLVMVVGEYGPWSPMANQFMGMVWSIFALVLLFALPGI